MAKRMRIPLPIFREVILSGPAWSWMMGHRGQNMIDGLIQPPTSMIDIFVKDMGIVVKEAASVGVSVPLASLVEQQFIAGRDRGWGRDDDSRCVRSSARHRSKTDTSSALFACTMSAGLLGTTRSQHECILPSTFKSRTPAASTRPYKMYLI